jgi:SAM-dependent methyltransferase
LYDSDLDYYIENNRRYVSDYWQPNDEEEQLRMQIMHQVFLFLLKSQLTSVPLTNPTRILDIGTGTGDWAIGIGEAFPDAEVIGTDLSAIQPSAVPPRVFFEIFNVEDEDDWTYPQDHFDLIHFRNMAGSFQSWDRMYGRAFAHLKPGGWIEVVDFDDQTNTFAKFFKEKSEMYNWYMALREAVILSGKEAGAAHLDPQRLSACGFVEVKVSRHELPVGVWPEEPDARSTAKLWLVACLAGFESVSLRLLTRHLRWEPDEVLRVCRNMEATLKSLAMDKEKAKGLSASVKILIGRKPIHSEDTGHQSDDLEAALEVDDAQPEGKRVKRDSTLKRREEQELSNVASAANPETEPETSKHDGNDSMMNEQL